jgi:uncharacterized protein with FMN-binding domain
MRRIVIGLMSTVSGLVLLFSYHTSTNSGGTALASGAAGSSSNDASGSSASSGAGGSSDDTSSGSDDGSASASGAGSSGSSSGSSSSSSGSNSSSSGTYTGEAVMTRWGIVQVEITVESGKITKSEAVQYPQENNRDVEINSYAVPALNEAAVQAQSANLDAVSGATVTTGGYTQSLQSAIDQAHL